ncbi:MAG: site-specific integrase [Kofleriaceae bacterium]
MSKPYKLPSGSWQIKWLDANGKRCSKTVATYELARTELRRIEVGTDEAKIRRERLGTGAMTVAEAAERFFAMLKRSPSDTERRFLSRKKSHTSHYNLHIKPHLEKVPLCDLSPAVLRRWIEALAVTRTQRPGEKKNEGGRTLAASSIRTAVSTLRQIAKASDVPLQVTLSDSLRQKRRRSRPRALQCIEDVRALIDACTDPWFRVAVALACYSGARLGEIASLRWRHIGDQTITIARSWEGPLKARYEDDEQGARVVPLDPELAAILAAWRNATQGGPDDRIVLVGGTRPMREGHEDMAAKTQSACKRAGLTPLTFHALRASFATIVADHGLPVSSLQVLMGHADVRTTGIYMRPESSRAALDPRARLSIHAGSTSAEPDARDLN